jgi:hypothetical protein
MKTKEMKTKPLTFLLALTFLFLFSGSVFGGDLQDGNDAYERKDYKTAHRLWLPLAEQGDAEAQSRLGWSHFLFYYVSIFHTIFVPTRTTDVLQDYALAHMWWNICGSGGDENCVKNRNIVEKEMTPSQSGLCFGISLFC